MAWPKFLAASVAVGYLVTGSLAAEIWSVKRAVSPAWQAERWGATLELTPAGITILQMKRRPLVIPRDAITAFTYAPVEFSHGKAIAKDHRPTGTLADLPIALTALALIKTRKFDHFVVLHWKELGVTREEVIEVGKNDYQAVLAALEKITGRPPSEKSIGLPAESESGRNLKITDKRGWTVNFQRELIDGEAAYCFPVVHAMNCRGTLCASRSSVWYRLSITGDDTHEFTIPAAVLAAQRPAKAMGHVRLNTPAKMAFTLPLFCQESCTKWGTPQAAKDGVTLFWSAATEFDAVEAELNPK